MTLQTRNLEVYVKGELVFTYTRGIDSFDASDVEMKVVNEVVEKNLNSTPLKYNTR